MEEKTAPSLRGINDENKKISLELYHLADLICTTAEQVCHNVPVRSVQWDEILQEVKRLIG